MEALATQRIAAYEKFMGGAKLIKIAEELNIPYTTVSKWSSEEGWATKREALEQEAFAIIEKDYQSFVLQNRKDVAERHLQYARMLQDRIKVLFEKNKITGNYNYQTSSQIKDLATALKAATDIDARVVGIDKPAAANVNIKIAPVIVTGANAQPRKILKAHQVSLGSPSPALPESKENGLGGGKSSEGVLEAEFSEVGVSTLEALPPF